MMSRPRRKREIGVTYRDETETFKKRLETVSRPRRSRPRLYNPAVQCSDVVPRGCLEAECSRLRIGLGLGLDPSCLGLGIGLESASVLLLLRGINHREAIFSLTTYYIN